MLEEQDSASGDRDLEENRDTRSVAPKGTHSPTGTGALGKLGCRA